MLGQFLLFRKHCACETAFCPLVPFSEVGQLHARAAAGRGLRVCLKDARRVLGGPGRPGPHWEGSDQGGQGQEAAGGWQRRTGGGSWRQGGAQAAILRAQESALDEATGLGHVERRRGLGLRWHCRSSGLPGPTEILSLTHV